MAVSIWEGNKAQALIDAIANTQKVDKQQGTANAGKALVVGSDGLVGLGNAGISDAAKNALLDCIRYVAWTDENGQQRYNALYQALFNEAPPVSYWDYEWSALSKTLPEGMTAANYNFKSDSNSMYILSPVMDLNYVGNLEIEIEGRFYNSQVEPYKGNNPQIIITNVLVSDNQYKGIKFISSSNLNTNTDFGLYAIGVNGQNTLTEIKSSEFHVIYLKAENSHYTLKVDGTQIQITDNNITSQYFGETGLVGGTPQGGVPIFGCELKSIKYKKLS